MTLLRSFRVLTLRDLVQGVLLAVLALAVAVYLNQYGS